MEKILEIKNITKKYGGMIAVDNVSFDICKGDLIGLVGHNGAGKTTLLVMLAGLTVQTSGSIKICGKDIGRNIMALKENISFLPDNTTYYENLTAKENLEYFCELASIDKARVPELLETVNMSKWADKKVGEFSKGMTQRIGFAQTLIKNPKVIFLDEPTSGLDPKARIEMNSLLRKLNEKGIAIVISSHVLSEIKNLCSKIAIMKQGKLIAYDTYSNLANHNNHIISLETRDAEKTVNVLNSMEGLSFMQQESVFKIVSDKDVRESISSILTENRITILSLGYEKEDQFEVFDKYYQVI